jgi:hypothetical protein
VPRQDGQPIIMRGRWVSGRWAAALVAHNTTHIDMPVHFLEGGADLQAVLNNPAYRVNLLLAVWSMSPPGLTHNTFTSTMACDTAS